MVAPMDTTTSQATEDRLNRALRITASQASSLTGGGAALLYTHAEGDPTTGRLRAAAGFKSADEALYRAKAEGRDRVVVSLVNKVGVKSQFLLI